MKIFVISLLIIFILICMDAFIYLNNFFCWSLNLASVFLPTVQPPVTFLFYFLVSFHLPPLSAFLCSLYISFANCCVAYCWCRGLCLCPQCSCAVCSTLIAIIVWCWVYEACNNCFCNFSAVNNAISHTSVVSGWVSTSLFSDSFLNTSKCGFSHE